MNHGVSFHHRTAKRGAYSRLYNSQPRPQPPFFFPKFREARLELAKSKTHTKSRIVAEIPFLLRNARHRTSCTTLHLGSGYNGSRGLKVSSSCPVRHEHRSCTKFGRVYIIALFHNDFSRGVCRGFSQVAGRTEAICSNGSICSSSGCFQ